MEENGLGKLRELVEFLKANDIADFAYEKGDLKLGLKFQGAGAASSAAGLDMARLAQMMAAQAPTVVTGAAQAAGVAEPASTFATAATPEEKHHIVKSPIVGTFYESSSPGSPPFVKIGDIVEVGQVLCIVEAMKLMNEIESDAAGEVMERIPSSGQPVEYGQSLFKIRAR